jgi:hypothetical protein
MNEQSSAIIESLERLFSPREALAMLSTIWKPSSSFFSASGSSSGITCEIDILKITHHATKGQNKDSTRESPSVTHHNHLKSIPQVPHLSNVNKSSQWVDFAHTIHNFFLTPAIKKMSIATFSSDLFLILTSHLAKEKLLRMAVQIKLSS